MTRGSTPVLTSGSTPLLTSGISLLLTSGNTHLLISGSASVLTSRSTPLLTRSSTPVLTSWSTPLLTSRTARWGTEQIRCTVYIQYCKLKIFTSTVLDIFFLLFLNLSSWRCLMLSRSFFVNIFSLWTITYLKTLTTVRYIILQSGCMVQYKSLRYA